jgi:serine/threonine protein kinase
VQDKSIDVLQVLDRILKVNYQIPRTPRVSEECKDLIRKLLVADPKQRLTIPQIQVTPPPSPSPFDTLSLFAYCAFS